MNRHAGYEALVADPEVDVVYVATPHPMHRDNAILALRASKPVLVEKPFTMNAVEAREIVQVARKDPAVHDGGDVDPVPAARGRDPGLACAGCARRHRHGDRGPRSVVVAEDPEFRMFAPELGGGARCWTSVRYPWCRLPRWSSASPDRIVAMSDPAFTGVDAQTSMLFGYHSGAQAVLTCTLRAKSPTRASIVGTDARIEIDGDFYAPTDITLIPRHGDPTFIESVHEGRGLRHQVDEVARPPGRRGP